MIIPGDTIPAYGTLPPAVERMWYDRYHWWWEQYTSPQNAAKRLASADDAYINWQWTAWDRPYKAAVWALMNDVERARIRNVRNNR